MSRVEEIARAAFELQDWINGSETGGIEPPRIIRDVAETSTDRGQKVEIEYTFPRTCGLSDCLYHHEGAGKLYREVFYLKGDRLLVEEVEPTSCGLMIKLSDKVFDKSTWLDEVNRDIADFYKKWNLQAA